MSCARAGTQDLEAAHTQLEAQKTSMDTLKDEREELLDERDELQRRAERTGAGDRSMSRAGGAGDEFERVRRSRPLNSHHQLVRLC